MAAGSSFSQLVAAALPHIRELMPWDVDALRREQPETLLVDIREADEYAVCHIAGSLLVPRGVLESACDWGYSDTVPELVLARTRPVVLVCRSGSRTALAALTLQQMGYEQVYSMKSGLRGWNDFELPLIDGGGSAIDADRADTLLGPPVAKDQLPPGSTKGSTKA